MRCLESEGRIMSQKEVSIEWPEPAEGEIGVPPSWYPDSAGDTPSAALVVWLWLDQPQPVYV